MSELVDQDHLWMPRDNGFRVHLFKGYTAILDLLARNKLQIAHLRLGLRTFVGLYIPDHNICPTLFAAVAFVEHGKRLADASGSTQIDAQAATLRLATRLLIVFIWKRGSSR